MHIGLLSPAWPAAAYPNGIVTYVDSLRDELIQQGHRVSVFAITAEKDDDAESVFVPRPGWRDRLAAAWSSRMLRRTATVFEFGRTIAQTMRRIHMRDPMDVIEMEESFGFSACVADVTRVPVVVKLHGPAFLTLVEEELNTPLGAEKVRREGDALTRQRVMISPSRCTLDDTIARYGLHPALALQVVNPVKIGQDIPLWNLATCDRETLLFVGRFDKVKGADILLEAFKLLVAERPALKLVFVGPDGGLARAGGAVVHLPEFVATLASPGLERRLSYRGRLDKATIYQLRTSALVTVVASRRENQPYAALEAMLQGCPVVCTDTSGLSEIVEHGVTGLKARPADPVDLAAQIMRIADEPSLGSALGAAARAYVLAHHSPERVVHQTIDVYRRAIALHDSSR